MSPLDLLRNPGSFYPSTNPLRNRGKDRKNVLQIADIIAEAHSLPSQGPEDGLSHGAAGWSRNRSNFLSEKRNLIFLIQTPIVKGRGRKHHEEGHL
jgi:hypothetical protein